MTDETRNRVKDEILDILRNSDYSEHEDTWEILLEQGLDTWPDNDMKNLAEELGVNYK